MRDPVSGRNYLPDDVNEKFLKVLQTSSVDEFNDDFKLLEGIASATAKGGANPVYPTVQELTDKANKLHTRLDTKGKWHGTSVPGTSVFTAGGNTPSGGGAGRGGPGRGRGQGRSRGRGGRGRGRGTLTCFNCGGSHALSECTQPLDETKIAANKKVFWDKKKQAAKWAPPTNDERSNGNKRIISGKLYKYDAAAGQWNKVDGAGIAIADSLTPAPSATAGSTGSGLPNPSGQQASRASVVTNGTDAERAAQRTAALNTLQQTFQNFASSIS